MIILIVILIFAAALAAAEWKWGVLSAVYDAKKLPHRLLALLPMVAMLFTVPVFLKYFADARDDVEYPLKGSVANYNPYIQQFDAWEKGQLNIDFEVDSRILELENPYDYQARRLAGGYYLWDRAMYDGKYYSYFGIAPIVTVYYPYWLIKGALPGDSTVMAVFIFITALFLPLALFKWAEVSGKRIPLVPLMLAAPAVFLSSGVLLVARGVSHFYYIAVIAGMAFLSAFIFFALSAFTAEKTASRCALYALAGVAYALLFLSRLNIAFLAAFLVVPGLWFMILRHDGKWRPACRIVAELASLGVPVASALCFSLWFNAARFSGPLDFGTNYQLTIADVSTYRLRLSDLPFALYNYFLAPAEACESYPYITFTRFGAAPSHYVYRDANLGLFCFPLTLGGIAAPFVICSQRESARTRVMTGSALLGIIVVAWLDFCKGGVIYRYTADLTLTASFLAAAVLLILLGNVMGSEKTSAWVRWTVYAAVCAGFVFSFAAALRVSLINGHSYISDIPDNVLEFFEKILPFAKITK